MKILDKIKQYIGLVDDLLISVLTDLQSLRYQLIIWAFVLNGVVLYLVYLGKCDYKLASVSIVLLTSVYALYFASKHHEAMINAAMPAEDDDVKTDRDPAA